MSIKQSYSRAFVWSMIVGTGFAIITFITNWLVLIHQDKPLTLYQLFDISFYYFTPLLSWAILTFITIKFFDTWVDNRANLKSIFFKLVIVILLLSPIVRVFDILVDYTLKNIIGMVQINPFKILNDVWLVVLFSTPTAAFKMILITIIVYLDKKSFKSSDTITIRTGDGTYHVIHKNSISYLQADGNYVIIRTNGDEYRTRETLKSLDAKLGSTFFRVHKSTVVNSNDIKQMKHWRNGEYLLIMSDDKPLTSSKSYKSAIDQIKEQIIENSAMKSDPKSATVHPMTA